MKLTPLDIHHKEFNHALRGYNEAEVDAFLDSVADELERLFKENIDLSERNEALEQKVRDYQDMERTLHNTLVSAQKSADELMQKTHHEADVVLKDAEVKAKEVIHNALTSKQKATNDLVRIKQAEEEFRVNFKIMLEHHLRSLAEVPLPEDIKLMVGQAGDETLSEAEVYTPAAPVTAPAQQSFAAPAEAAPGRVAEPAGVEPPDSGFVASLHLGDLGGADLPPDATVEFDVVEFGFGEREDDHDIEEID
jgi:cell division initiation protein